MKKSKAPEQMKVYSVRVSEEQMRLAELYKIDTAELFRQKLAEEISKKQGKCPCCGRKNTKWEPF